jgi:hypothetical protein
VEEAEAHRLLQHRVAVDLDVGGVPEVVEVGRWPAARPSHPA